MTPLYPVFLSYKLDMYCMISEAKINEIECWHPLIVYLTCSTCVKDRPTVGADFETDKHLRKCI